MRVVRALGARFASITSGKRLPVIIPGSDLVNFSKLDTFTLILGERRIAFGASRRRKVRTPQSTMPRNFSFWRRDTRGQNAKTF